MNSERMAAWVDGEGSTALARQAMTAHIAACPQCAAYVAELRAHKERLAQFGASTTPVAVPSNLWENVRAGLDQVDAARRAEEPSPRQPFRRLRLAGLVAAAMLSAAVVLALALSFLRPRVLVPLDWLRSTPIVAPLTDGTASLATQDADRAARWIGQQLDADIPTVNLTLNGAETMGAEVDAGTHRGTLFYRAARGEPVALYLFLRARADLSRLQSLRYKGAMYHSLERAGNGNTLVAWEAEDRLFVAAAPMPASDLLPLAHEMSRRCHRL